MKYFTVISISKSFLCCIFWIFVSKIDKIFTNLLPYTFWWFEGSNTKLSTFNLSTVPLEDALVITLLVAVVKLTNAVFPVIDVAPIMFGAAIISP